MNTQTEIFIILWIMCGTLHYGLWFAHFQRKYPGRAKEAYNFDMILGILTAFLGPIALFSTLLSGFYKHGFKLK